MTTQQSRGRTQGLKVGMRYSKQTYVSVLGLLVVAFSLAGYYLLAWRGVVYAIVLAIFVVLDSIVHDRFLGRRANERNGSPKP